MSEDTVESLIRRIEALERAVGLGADAPRPKNWRRVVGMFGNSRFMKRVDAEGQAIRKAERAKARASERAS
jgi:hypothetical protein